MDQITDPNNERNEPSADAGSGEIARQDESPVVAADSSTGFTPVTTVPPPPLIAAGNTQAAASDVAPDKVDTEIELCQQKINSAAGWYTTIAVLSIINSVIALFNGSITFVVGLGATQIVDAIAGDKGMGGKAIGFCISLAIAGMYYLFGVNARKRQGWAFTVGLILYLLDGLIYLIDIQDGWINIAFHVWAWIAIFTGARAASRLKKIEESQFGVRV